MGIEVTFAQVEPTSSESANNLMYRKTSVRSTSAVPIVSLKPTASISYKTEAPMQVVTVKPTASLRTTSSSEQAPVRTLTTTVQPPETQPSPAAGGAEGGPVVPTLVPDRAAERYAETIPAPQEDQIIVPSNQKPKSSLPYLAAGVGGLIVLGFLLRRKRR